MEQAIGINEVHLNENDVVVVGGRVATNIIDCNSGCQTLLGRSSSPCNRYFQYLLGRNLSACDILREIYIRKGQFWKLDLFTSLWNVLPYPDAFEVTQRAIDERLRRQILAEKRSRVTLISNANFPPVVPVPVFTNIGQMQGQHQQLAQNVAYANTRTVTPQLSLAPNGGYPGTVLSNIGQMQGRQLAQNVAYANTATQQMSLAQNVNTVQQQVSLTQNRNNTAKLKTTVSEKEPARRVPTQQGREPTESTDQNPGAHRRVAQDPRNPFLSRHRVAQDPRSPFSLMEADVLNNTSLNSHYASVIAHAFVRHRLTELRLNKSVDGTESLVSLWNITPYPSLEQIGALAEAHNLDLHAVGSWFARLRKQIEGLQSRRQEALLEESDPTISLSLNALPEHVRPYLNSTVEYESCRINSAMNGSSDSDKMDDDPIEEPVLFYADTKHKDEIAECNGGCEMDDDPVEEAVKVDADTKHKDALAPSETGGDTAEDAVKVDAYRKRRHKIPAIDSNEKTDVDTAEEAAKFAFDMKHKNEILVSDSNEKTDVDTVEEDVKVDADSGGGEMDDDLVEEAVEVDVDTKHKNAIVAQLKLMRYITPSHFGFDTKPSPPTLVSIRDIPISKVYMESLQTLCNPYNLGIDIQRKKRSQVIKAVSETILDIISAGGFYCLSLSDAVRLYGGYIKTTCISISSIIHDADPSVQCAFLEHVAGAAGVIGSANVGFKPSFDALFENPRSEDIPSLIGRKNGVKSTLLPVLQRAVEITLSQRNGSYGGKNPWRTILSERRSIADCAAEAAIKSLVDTDSVMTSTGDGEQPSAETTASGNPQGANSSNEVVTLVDAAGGAHRNRGRANSTHDVASADIATAADEGNETSMKSPKEVISLIEHVTLDSLKTIADGPPKLATKTKMVDFGDGRQWKKFVRVSMVLAISHCLLRHRQMATVRGVFYKAKQLFMSQRNAERSIIDAAKLLDVTRGDLGIFASAKGLFCAYDLQEMNGIDVYNLTCETATLVSPTWAHREGSTFTLRSKAKFILVIEKKSVFDVCVDIRLQKELECILVCGAGFPDLATRAFVFWLARKLGLNVYGTCDDNPFGLAVLRTYENAGPCMGKDGGDSYGVQIRVIGLMPSQEHWMLKEGFLPENDDMMYQPFGDRDKAFLVSLLDKNGVFLCNSPDREARLEELIKMEKNQYKIELDVIDQPKLLKWFVTALKAYDAR